MDICVNCILKTFMLSRVSNAMKAKVDSFSPIKTVVFRTNRKFYKL
jgi:hypothetical protein